MESKVLIIVSIILQLASCSFFEDERNFEEDYVYYRALWDEHNLQNYTYDYSQAHQIFYDYPLTITVSNGEAVSALNSNGTPGYGWKDIESCFAEIEDAIYGIDHGPADIIEYIYYDSEYGYPTSCAIDWDTGVYDEETYFQIENLSVQ